MELEGYYIKHEVTVFASNSPKPAGNSTSTGSNETEHSDGRGDQTTTTTLDETGDRNTGAYTLHEVSIVTSDSTETDVDETDSEIDTETVSSTVTRDESG